MTIALLGASGQLGTALRKIAGQTPHEWVYADRHADTTRPYASTKLDLTDEVAVFAFLEQNRPRIVINAAAWTAVDRAENEEAAATAVNGEVPDIIGRWARENSSLVIHVSTDYVFDGNARTPYRESDPTGPLNAYGRSKLAGEAALLRSGAPHLILRTAWLYSATHPSFLRTVLRLANDNAQLRIVADQHGTPTSADTLARAIMRAAEHWLAASTEAQASVEGTYHVVADGETTWHGFATAIVEGAFQRRFLERRPTVVPILASDYPTLARRPSYSVLDNMRFKTVFSCDLPRWDIGLEETLDNLQLKNGSE